MQKKQKGGVLVLGTSSAGKTSAVRATARKTGCKAWYIDNFRPTPRQLEQIKRNLCPNGKFEGYSCDDLDTLGKIWKDEETDVYHRFRLKFINLVRENFNKDIDRHGGIVAIDDIGVADNTPEWIDTKIVLFTKFENLKNNALKRTRAGDPRYVEGIFMFYNDIFDVTPIQENGLERMNFASFERTWNQFPTTAMFPVQHTPRQAWNKLTDGNILCATADCYVHVKSKHSNFTVVRTADENGKYMNVDDIADKIIKVAGLDTYKPGSTSSSDITNNPDNTNNSHSNNSMVYSVLLVTTLLLSLF